MNAVEDDNRDVDPEMGVIARLLQAADMHGVQADRASIVDFYVAVKSHPLAVLVGAPNTGKVSLVKALASALTDDDPLRCQAMVGHAWWAAGSSNVALFTQAQWRFNTEKILSLIEEARRPCNAQRTHIAGLLRMSPAELSGLLAPLAAQLSRAGTLYFPASGSTEAVLMPANFLIVGTLDATPPRRFRGPPGLNLVILRPKQAAPETFTVSQGMTYPPAEEFDFRKVCLREQHAARQRLGSILGRPARPLRPLLEVEALLRHANIHVRLAELSQALIYMANAWSVGGTGLFEPFARANIQIALDIAIERIFLSHIGEIRDGTAALIRGLHKVLGGRFIRAASLVP